MIEPTVHYARVVSVPQQVVDPIYTECITYDDFREQGLPYCEGDIRSEL